MERNSFEQQITPTPKNPDKHAGLPREPRSEADTKAKVSAIFVESDLNEDVPVRREPVRRAPVKRESVRQKPNETRPVNPKPVNPKPVNPKPVNPKPTKTAGAAAVSTVKPAMKAPARPEGSKVAKTAAKPARPEGSKVAKTAAKPVRPEAAKTAAAAASTVKPAMKAPARPEGAKVAKPAAKPVRPEAAKVAKPVAKPVRPETAKVAKPETINSKDKQNLVPEITPTKTEEQKNPEPAKAKTKSPRKIILTIIIIIAACGFLFSGYKLFTILRGYKEGSDTYKEVEHIVKPAPTPEKQEEEVFTVDINALKELNSDTKGYLYCKDLLSYPVVQCEDNSYYLTHLFNGEWNSCGCLFIDCNLPDAFESRNCIIYGHNMNDGSMFASLYKYDDEEFYKTHKEFDVFTEGHHYIYKVLSLFVTPVDGFVYTYDFASDEDFVNFLNTAASYSPYETDYGELTPDRKVITMSTCLGNNDETQRFVVMLIRDREVTE